MNLNSRNYNFGRSTGLENHGCNSGFLGCNIIGLVNYSYMEHAVSISVKSVDTYPDSNGKTLNETYPLLKLDYERIIKLNWIQYAT